MKEYLNPAVLALKRSSIREFAELAAQTPDCIRLTLGEPEFDTPERIKAAVQIALDNHQTHYIPNAGIPALRQKIAACETERHAFAVTPEQVIVTDGATEALMVTLTGVLSPGDEIIIPTPAFLLYEQLACLCGAKVVPLDITEDGFQINEQKLRALITPRTRAVLLNSPHNPTGTILNRDSLEAVRQTVKGKPIFVICDDVYRDLAYAEYHSFTEFADMNAQTILIQSFSKSYAMTGWRMGYLVAAPEIAERLTLVHQYAVTSTPAPFQTAAIAALDEDTSHFTEIYKSRRDYCLRRLEQMNMPVTAPTGAFYVFPDIRAAHMSSADFCRALIRSAGVALTPGECFGAEGFVRISYCVSDDELHRGLDRLEAFWTEVTK